MPDLTIILSAMCLRREVVGGSTEDPGDESVLDAKLHILDASTLNRAPLDHDVDKLCHYRIDNVLGIENVLQIDFVAARSRVLSFGERGRGNRVVRLSQ